MPRIPIFSRRLTNRLSRDRFNKQNRKRRGSDNRKTNPRQILNQASNLLQQIFSVASKTSKEIRTNCPSCNRLQAAGTCLPNGPILRRRTIRPRKMAARSFVTKQSIPADRNIPLHPQAGHRTAVQPCLRSFLQQDSRFTLVALVPIVSGPLDPYRPDYFEALFLHESQARRQVALLARSCRICVPVFPGP